MLSNCLLLVTFGLLGGLVSSTTQARTDELAFTRLDVNEGLSQGVVNTVTEDRHGFVWLGTQLGLNRYDGTQFRIYTHDPDIPGSLPDDWVWSLGVDNTGQLWVGMDSSGLARFNEQTETFELLGSFDGDVRSMVQDAEGFFWLASDRNGLGRFDPAAADPGATLEWFNADNSALNSNRVRTLHIDGFGSLWVGTFDDGAYRFDSLLQKLIPLNLQGQWSSIRAITGGGAQPLWLGTSANGLLKLDTDTGLLEHYQSRGAAGKKLSSDHVRVLYTDASGDVWVGHDTDGLDRIDSLGNVSAFRNVRTQSSTLPDNHINALFQDYSGLMWIGTHRGAAVWNPETSFFRNYAQNTHLAPGLSENWISGFAVQGGNRYWVSTYGGGINLLDVETGVTEVLRHEPGQNSLSDDRSCLCCRTAKAFSGPVHSRPV